MNRSSQRSRLWKKNLTTSGKMYRDKGFVSQLHAQCLLPRGEIPGHQDDCFSEILGLLMNGTLPAAGEDPGPAPRFPPIPFPPSPGPPPTKPSPPTPAPAACIASGCIPKESARQCCNKGHSTNRCPKPHHRRCHE
jgi:hypothetical protein